MNFKKIFFGIIFSFLIFGIVNAVENKILFKVNNEIITSFDIYNELRYLQVINEKFKNIEKKQAFEIAKRSLIREKIKEIELQKVLKELKIEDQILENILINYFKKIQIKSTSDFKTYFSSINIDPNLIKKKITTEILWNEFIFDKYNQSVKINRQAIINDIKRKDKQKEFLLSEILFDVNENEKIDEKFKLIKNKIEKTSFSETALTYSSSATADKGGELGWIKETSLSKKINNLIQNIDIGNYSEPIVIPGGFLILKIEDVREVDSYVNLNKEVEKIIKEKTNEQLNQFSNIFFNKVRKNININEL
jgi:peptidyl-prolyl cis-trans isomerase SurA|tara:strand:- start:278 stop:1201 length:924 start_codon:yes stop_codon:yes gene_type:complete